MERKMPLQLDEWQKEYIAYQGDKILVAGRQTGKSEAQAYDNAEFAATHAGTTTLIISKTERQAEELLIKTFTYLADVYPKRIGRGKYKPLKSVVYVTHPGHTDKKPITSRVISLPIGRAAEGIRGYTIHKLSVDEAQLPPDAVYDAVLPMLLTTGGKISLTGTPQGKRGFFWRSYENKLGHFKVFRINSEKVHAERQITDSWPQFRKDEALAFLQRMKLAMGEKQYRQEFLAEFLEDVDQFFPDSLIEKCCILKRVTIIDKKGKYGLGVDVGRTQDPSTFQILNAKDEKKVRQEESIVKKEYSITQTALQCINLDQIYNFETMGIDGNGMGSGVVDILLDTEQTRRKTMDLNNAKRAYEYGDTGGHTRLIKEDMYRWLLVKMEKGEIELLDDDEVKNSLKSVVIEVNDETGKLQIWGNDTHIAEGIIRALYPLKGKHSNIWIDSIKL